MFSPVQFGLRSAVVVWIRLLSGPENTPRRRRAYEQENEGVGRFWIIALVRRYWVGRFSVFGGQTYNHRGKPPPAASRHGERNLRELFVCERDQRDQSRCRGRNRAEI